MSKPLGEFSVSPPLTLGVELELQLLSPRDFDLTRGATDLLAGLDYDQRFGDVKLEITESMIEVSTQPRASVPEIASDLAGLRDILARQCRKNNIAFCGGGTHPFHRWAERRICSGERFSALYERYGYLAKQFTVFGEHIHVGCASADDAIWLTQALGAYVPMFIALSASSPYVDGVDTFFQSARLNAVSAFPLSGQCPPLADWQAFVDHFYMLQTYGIASSIKDLYWDVRPKPEYGTVEIRVCDTPLTMERAAALAALAQALSRWLLRTRPALDGERQMHIARYNKFQACRYGLAATSFDPLIGVQRPLRLTILDLLQTLTDDARELGSSEWLDGLRQLTQWLDGLRPVIDANVVDATWLRTRHNVHGDLNEVVRDASVRMLARPSRSG